MRHARAVLRFLVAASVLSLSSPCKSDMSPPNPCSPDWGPFVPSVITLAGGSICPPVPHDRIRMDLMEVTIRLKPESYVIDAAFHLFNTGQTMTELVGFPKHGEVNEPSLDGSPPAVSDFMQLDTWVDGRKVEFVEKPRFFRGLDTFLPHHPPLDNIPIEELRDMVMAETRWMVKAINFRGYARTVVSTRYQARYFCWHGSLAQDVAYYYFGTAQYWKGKIRKAVFIVDSTSTGGRNQGIVYNIDPRFNVRVWPIRKRIRKNLQSSEIRGINPPVTAYVSFGPGVRYPR